MYETQKLLWNMLQKYKNVPYMRCNRKPYRSDIWNVFHPDKK